MSQHRHSRRPSNSLTPSSSSKIIPILGGGSSHNNNNNKKSILDSPATSATHSSSISSLGLIENFNRQNLYNSNDANVDDSSSESSSDLEDSANSDLNLIIRNDNSKFDKSNVRRSFEEVFKMDSIPSPVTNKFSTLSSEDERTTTTVLQQPPPPPSSSKRSSSPNVFFKKLMSKSSLKPQSKSFKRITKELQQESQPLQAEINNEAAVTFALKDEEMLLEKGVFNNNNLAQNETLKKYELINRANRLWNHSNDNNSTTTNNNKTSIIHNIDLSLNSTAFNSKKRKSIDINNNEVTDQSFIKRRVVSTSPKLTGSTSPMLPHSRRNSKLMQSTSDDLEKMSL